MSETKYTSTPWKQAGDYKHMIVSKQEDGKEVVIAYTYDQDVPTAEQLANARLIAKAPVMFEYILKHADAGCAEAKQIMEKVYGSR